MKDYCMNKIELRSCSMLFLDLATAKHFYNFNNLKHARQNQTNGMKLYDEQKFPNTLSGQGVKIFPPKITDPTRIKTECSFCL